MVLMDFRFQPRSLILAHPISRNVQKCDHGRTPGTFVFVENDDTEFLQVTSAGGKPYSDANTLANRSSLLVR